MGSESNQNRGIGGNPQWFVLVNGDVVGPLATDALITLVRKGGLLPEDNVRLGDVGRWMPASSIEGLLDHAPAEFAERPDLHPQLRSDDSQRQAGSGKRAKRAPSDHEHSVGAADAARDSLAHHHLRGVKPGSEGATADDDGTASRAAEKTSEVLSRTSEAITGGATSLQDGLGLAWENGIDGLFWCLALPRRLIHSKIALALIACAVIGSALVIAAPSRWWNWRPPEIPYDAYASIMDELKRLRSLKTTPEEWNRFADMSKTRLAALVPSLEKKARISADREALSLLWIGRDYLPRALDDARNEPSESERQVEMHMGLLVRVASRPPTRRRTSGSGIDSATMALIIFDGVIVLGAAIAVGWFIFRKRRANHY